MSLTVGSYCIADIHIQAVGLQPVVGACELHFPLYVQVNISDDMHRRAVISGARVILKPAAGGEQAIGFARPEIPLTIEPGKFPTNMTPVFSLALQPQQIAAIEEKRAGGDLSFELRAVGHGADSQTSH